MKKKTKQAFKLKNAICNAKLETIVLLSYFVTIVS